MASSSSYQQNQGFNTFFEIESDSTSRKVSESSRLYDVFINHRGPDVKQTLAAQLYNSLQAVGIRAFLDSEEKELGVSFPSTIETAIKSAKVHIAIFSKGYAESPWCLAELVLMLQSEAKVIPVFYQVKPSALRFVEKGEYAEAFTEYVNKKRYLEKLPEWKKALQSLSFVAGEEFNIDCKNIIPSDCKNIILAVQKEIRKKTCLHVATYPVGLDDLVEDFERRCLDEIVLDFENQCGIQEVGYKSKVVGIFGMGGAGKTTLAKELFNRKCSNYSRSSFLFDVREAFERRQLPYLQLKLLNDLFPDRSPGFISTEEGTSYLKDRVQRSPLSSFLIVVDDVDHVEQLNDLMIMDILNKFNNSLVIVTTRDVGVLINSGITLGYRLKGMDRNNGRELFCWHAFGKRSSSSGYEALVDAFVDVCGGLPLSLRVLGRHVHGRRDSFWRSALVEAKRALAQDVKQTLRISFDALGAEEKQVFMDIACFFVGRVKSVAERVWEGSGWNAQYALETLKDKCLVEEIEIVSLNEFLHVHKELELRMHDHLRDLGREMASELSTPLRWWHRQDLEYLESMGLLNILANTNVRCFHSIFDEFTSCQVTFFLGQADICVGRSNHLLWLELEFKSTEQTSIPSWISLQYVQCLKIKNDKLKTLWENSMQAHTQLKELHIYGTSLERIPDMAWISGNFGKVILDAHGWPIQGLSLLESLNMNLRSLNLRSSMLIGEQASTRTEEGITCESLVILNFKFSGEVAWNNGGRSSRVRAPMGGLEKLEISGEELVTKILVSGIHYPSLESLKLYCMENLMKVDLISIKKLNCLDITNCKNLKSVSGITSLEKLELLNISQCPEIEELILGHLRCLERITIVDCEHLKSVSGSQDLGNLAQLNISECPELGELRLEHLSCLEKLSIEKCSQLETVTGINDLARLAELEIYDCGKVEFECLRLSGMRCLETIIFDRNVKVKHLEVDNCQNLKTIKYGCKKIARSASFGYPELEKFLIFEDPICLVGVIINGCGKFNHLRLINCQNLKTVSGNLEIGELTIKKCSELEELPGFSSLSCVKNIHINSCGKLQDIMLPKSLTNLSVTMCSDLQRVSATGDISTLTELYIDECPGLVELPNSSNMSCAKNIHIISCGKLQDIMLPTSLTSLSVTMCSDLQRVSATGDLSTLTELYIDECPGLVELPNSSSMSCAKNIHINSCGKLQDIMLPKSLTSLSITMCSDLQRVSATGDLSTLTELYIDECPELVELPNFSSLSCMEEIHIISCGKLQDIMLPTKLFLKGFNISSSEKLQNMEEIQELHVTNNMRLCYCSNAVIRNCIDKLKGVPRNGILIGRAVDGAESGLNEYLFSEADRVTDIVKFDVEDIGDEDTDGGGGLMSIICCVVEFDSSTSLEDLNFRLILLSYDFDIYLLHGEWIITIIGPGYMRLFSECLKVNWMMKTGFQTWVRKKDEWKSIQILNRIVDGLYNS